MTNNLTLVATLPMGGGCLASLPAEKNEPIKVQMKSEYFQEEPLPKIDTVDEMATKMLAAVQRAH